MPPLPRRVVRSAALVAAPIALASGASCGSRSGLEPPCEDGARRACDDACGSGVQSCALGFWQRCSVPVRVEACEDACGEGERRCEAGALGPCVVPARARPCSSACGEGTETCAEGQWGACTAPRPLPPVIEATIRDFSAEHPDFQSGRVDDDPGIVEARLGPDDKPVYAGGVDGTLTTSGREYFDQWFRDVPGVNLARRIELPLARSETDDRTFVFDGMPFFPINDELLGNEGFQNNYHFTLEAFLQFDYVGGEVFTFVGDDDVWVFVNGYLAIDLGGVHSERSQSVLLDELAPLAGLQVGSRHSLHLFFAERQTFGSNFYVETSVADRGRCPEVR